MSAEYSTARMELNNPRAVWTIGMQLFLSLFAMIPVYYYMKNIVELDNDARFVLLFTPIAVAILLFVLQLLMNEFYWFEEKIYLKRDIVTMALKSYVFIITLFYLLYLLMFGYWLSGSDVYNEKFGVKNDITKVLVESGISILTIVAIVIFRKTIQEQK